MNTTSDEIIENEEMDTEVIDAAIQDSTDDTSRSPEVDSETEKLTTWDEPTDIAGGEVTRVPLEDEASAPEQLVAEGLEEADHEQRIAAVDPDFEA